MERDSIKVYELFKGNREQGYFAVHTLDKLNDNKKIKEHFNELQFDPYLILRNLTPHPHFGTSEEKIFFENLEKRIIPRFWKEKSYQEKLKNQKLITKINNPSDDAKFMKTLLFQITKDESYSSLLETNKEKAEELFYLFAEKKHLNLLMEELKLNANLYHRSESGRDSLDD